MLKTEDDFKQRHVAGCVRVFLEGKQNINWVMAFIRGLSPMPILLATRSFSLRVETKDCYDMLSSQFWLGIPGTHIMIPQGAT
jgi:hypothetical protein